MEQETAPKKSTRRRTFEVAVSDVVVETHDTVTLEYFGGEDVPEYKAGQFLVIDPHQFDALRNAIGYLEDAKGAKEPPRAYSLGSSPLDKDFNICIKIEPYVSGQTKYPPLLSPYLVRCVTKGQRMVVSGFSGAYCLGPEIDEETDHVVHVCAGSGIVPNYAMIRWALGAGVKARHTLVYGNKTWDDVIYRRQLDDLVDRFPGKLRVLHALSREAELARMGGREVRKGRVGVEILREAIEDPSSVRIYTCGPAITRWEKLKARETGTEATPRFLETVLASLEEIGVGKTQIHKEAYG